MREPKFSRRLSALVIGAVMMTAACGGDSEDSSEDTTVTTEAPVATTQAPAPTDAPPATEAAAAEGCGDGAATDPSDESADRTIARCDPGFPAAEPLPEPTVVRVSSAFRAEFTAPVLIADELGLFEEENIQLEWVELPLTDALGELDSCAVDFAIGGTEASFHNGIASGLDVKMVLGNFFPPSAGDISKPQTGLWVRRDVFTNPDDPDLSEMSGLTIASPVGSGSPVVYPLSKAFADDGLSVNDLNIQTIPAPEIPVALENNAVQGAWVLDPFWASLAAAPETFTLVATQLPGEPLGGLYAGPCIREGERRDIGVAFIRAYIRAVNTYLTGDYKDDPVVFDALVAQTGATAEALQATPELIFDWEVRSYTSQRIQEYHIALGSASYEEILTDEQVVDRSLYLEAVGKS